MNSDGRDPRGPRHAGPVGARPLPGQGAGPVGRHSAAGRVPGPAGPGGEPSAPVPGRRFWHPGPPAAPAPPTRSGYGPFVPPARSGRVDAADPEDAYGAYDHGGVDRYDDHDEHHRYGEPSARDGRHRRDGHDDHGYDDHGYDDHGYDDHGYDEHGYDQHGYDQHGYDQHGYDQHGHDQHGHDRHGYDGTEAFDDVDAAAATDPTGHAVPPYPLGDPGSATARTRTGTDADTGAHTGEGTGYSDDYGADYGADHGADHGDTDSPTGPPDPPRRGGGGGGSGGGRRVAVLLAAVVVLLGAVVGGGVFVYNTWFATPDFDGDGTGNVFIQVEQGDSTRQIGGTLAKSGVVASVDAFVEAAADNDRIRSVQPGYYQLRLRMSGAAAVKLLLDPSSRVGQLDIRGGVQLDDTRAPDGAVVPGVLSLISKATCVQRDGAEQCLSADDLRRAMEDTDPAALGVPEWALEHVEKADPARRLEGLIAPGRYDVPPDTSAPDVLHDLLTTSAARLEATGLVSGAQKIGSDPYEVLTIASLVEKEAITPDMPKVARVIYNRLGAGRKLELDSMVNYPLDLQALRTTAQDRARPGPYNGYLNTGLPPTPISAPGNTAIAAALAPAPGAWLYFVRCQPDGTSCFADTFAQHSANVREAQANGAF